MGVGAVLYMCDVVKKSSRSLSHLLMSSCFTRHVEFCTSNDAILFDLVITDEPNMAHNMTDLGPFLGSDHNALCWHLEVNTKQEILRKRSLDYSKAGITSLKCELSIRLIGMYHYVT